MSRTILFVDDDADDRDLVADILKEVNPLVNAVFAENGLKAIEYLKVQKLSEGLPCLIVLDLNMPLLDGRATYKKIKQELQLVSVPVIVFTSSQNPDDRSLFAGLGVEFITKPADFHHFNEIVNHMVNVCNAS